MTTDRTAPRSVSAAAYVRLKRASERLPRLALVGDAAEARRGVLRILLEDRLGETVARRHDMPPVWYSYGAPAAWWMDADRIIRALDPHDLDSAPERAILVRVFAEAEALAQCDLVEAAMTGGDPAMRRLPAAMADIPFWCQLAGTSPSEAEAEAVAALRAPATMVLVRGARQIASASDGGIGISPSEALRALAADDPDEAAALWEASGAAVLMELAEDGVRQVGDRRALALGRYVVAAQAPGTAVRPHRVAPSAARRADRPAATDLADRMARIRADIAGVIDIEGDPDMAPLPAEVMPVTLARHAATRGKVKLFASGRDSQQGAPGAFGTARRPATTRS